MLQPKSPFFKKTPPAKNLQVQKKREQRTPFLSPGWLLQVLRLLNNLISDPIQWQRMQRGQFWEQQQQHEQTGLHL